MPSSDHRLGRRARRGAPHPALIDPDSIEIVGERYTSARCEVFGYEPGWPVVSPGRREAVEALIGEPGREHQDASAVGDPAGGAG